MANIFSVEGIVTYSLKLYSSHNPKCFTFWDEWINKTITTKFNRLNLVYKKLRRRISYVRAIKRVKNIF